MDLPADFPERMGPAMVKAFDAMDALESGAIANPDEGRMVGHYWLRAPELAPDDAIREAIRATPWTACWNSPGACTAASCGRPAAERFDGCWSSASAARRWDRSSSPTRWAARATA